MVLSFDKEVPNPRDGGIYYLISVDWFDKWQKWINAEDGMPGPVDNTALMGASGRVKEGLRKVVDYRAVNGGVYWAFKTLHGAEFEIRSWNTEWEGEMAGGIKVEDYAKRCRMDAEEAVRRMKVKINNQGGKGGLKRAKRPVREEELWCGCLSEGFLGRVIECAFTCCRKGSEGYKKYKKVEEDLEERVSMLAGGEDGEL